MDLAVVVLIVLVMVLFLGLLGGIIHLNSLALKERRQVEEMWRELYVHASSEASDLRNRLMTHSWSEYANVQTAIPQPYDRANETLPHVPVNRPSEEEDSVDQVEEALRQAGVDLEGDAWSRPVVG